MSLLISQPQFAAATVILITEHAVAVSLKDETPDPVQACIWGYIYGLQERHPGRIVLVDADADGAGEDEEKIGGAIPAGAALMSGEPRLALRKGAVLVPRLARVSTWAAVRPM